MWAAGATILGQVGGSVVTVSSSGSDDTVTNVVILLACCGTGALLLFWGIRLLQRTRHLRAVGERAEGVVQQQGLGVGADGRARQVVQFRFRTAAGEHVDLVSNGAHFGRHHPGETAPILYDPADPQMAQIDQPTSLTLPWVVLIGGGAFLVLFGVAMVVLL